MKAEILNFPLQTFIHNVFEEVKKRQDEILRKRTNFLYREAYRYFLDLYLIRVANEKRVDLPAFYYEQGFVICEEAKYKAEKVMLDVIKDGRINQCYTKRIKEMRNLRRVSGAKLEVAKTKMSDNEVKRMTGFCGAIFQDNDKQQRGF